MVIRLIKFLNYVMLLELSHLIDVMRETNIRGCLFVRLKYCKLLFTVGGLFEVRKRRGLSFVGFWKARREDFCVFGVAQ